jgi:glycine hydroxymethyltransferase
MTFLKKTDPVLYKFIENEKVRQTEGLELIPSENYVSQSVLEAMGSILTNKYSEGYAGHRYYGGNDNIDDIENLAMTRACKLFKVPYVNVQPYSGSPANFAVYNAILEPGDVISGMNLSDGGHLTHGWKVSATAKYFKSYSYHVKKNGYVDFDDVWKIAKTYKPKLIWAGATAYAREVEFEKFAEIADSIGAYFAADIAHIAGLILGGVHKSPVPYAHIVTTTTHKTLRGPRGAMIMVTEKGMKKDPELGDKINRSIFPGLQGGPHNHITAGIATALDEAGRPEFAKYATQIVANAKAMADEFTKGGISLVSGGTDNHLMVLDLSREGHLGSQLEYAMDIAHMTANKNTIPSEPASPYYPSGLRLGTPALTTRGLKETDMRQIARWIIEIIDYIKPYKLPEEKEKRGDFIKGFKQKMKDDVFLKQMSKKVRKLAMTFPVPGITD